MWRLLLLVAAAPAFAENVVATRTIRANTLIAAEDLSLAAGIVPGGTADPAEIIGMEARITLYAGRPVRVADVVPPALVERNQLVTLTYRYGALAITTEARALSRGGLGEVVRVMNLASRATVLGAVQADGTILAGEMQ